MGATVVHDGFVKFRFRCRRCDWTGPEHTSAEEAHQDGVAHQSTWAQYHGTVRGYANRWSYACKSCGGHDVTPPTGVESEQAAHEYGWDHETRMHHDDFHIEQLGTYVADDPEGAEGAYDNENYYCGEPDNQSIEEPAPADDPVCG